MNTAKPYEIHNSIEYTIQERYNSFLPKESRRERRARERKEKKKNK